MLPAVILAAGLGRRLGDLTEDRPKALLPVGETTFLDLQLNQLEQCGVEEVFVVTGHQHNTLLRHVGHRAICLYNEHYATTNNLVSLSVARPSAKNGFILINCDALFHERILQGLLTDAAANALAVDDHRTLDAEDMKVVIRHGKIVSISKGLPLESSHGEYIGLARFDALGASKLFSAIESLIAEQQHHAWYEAAISRILSEIPVAAFSVAEHPWIEVDDLSDLAQARDLVARGALRVHQRA